MARKKSHAFLLPVLFCQQLGTTSACVYSVDTMNLTDNISLYLSIWI